MATHRTDLSDTNGLYLASLRRCTEILTLSDGEGEDSACHVEEARGELCGSWWMVVGGWPEYRGRARVPWQRHNTAQSISHSSFHHSLDHNHASGESWVMEKPGLCGLSRGRWGRDQLPSQLVEPAQLQKAHVPSFILNLLPLDLIILLSGKLKLTRMEQTWWPSWKVEYFHCVSLSFWNQ